VLADGAGQTLPGNRGMEAASLKKGDPWGWGMAEEEKKKIALVTDLSHREFRRRQPQEKT